MRNKINQRLKSTGLLTVLFFSISGFLAGTPAWSNEQILRQASAVAQPLEDYQDIDELIDYLAQGELVLLGEASHGTREFYEWRAYISRRLIEDHDFDFIAVESDWPSHFSLNKFVKGELADIPLDELFKTFDRWPPWMWRNQVIVDLTQWLHSHNQDNDSPVGFYGMDMQAERKAFNQIQSFLNDTEHELTEYLLEKLNCLEPYLEDVRGYVYRKVFQDESCKEEIQELHRSVTHELFPLLDLNAKEKLEIERNLSLLVHGERRWRSHVDETLDNWNVRVEYMRETVNTLRKHYGENSKGIIWAHNTHVGDARATAMAEAGRINIGQLARERLGAGKVRILGFGTARGTVKAGRSWGAPGEIMRIPEPQSGSVEKIFSGFNNHITLLNLHQLEQAEGPLFETLGHRAIGVVYQPEQEHLGNFVPTVLPERYDAFIFFQNTNALREWNSQRNN